MCAPAGLMGYSLDGLANVQADQSMLYLLSLRAN